MKAYIPVAGPNVVSVVDIATNTISATISVGSNPVGVAVTPDGNTVYVTNSADTTVSIIDSASNTVRNTLALSETPGGVAVSPNGVAAYVSCYSPGEILVINTATAVIRTTIALPSGTGPTGIAFTPDGTLAYVADGLNPRVLIIDTTTDSVSSTRIQVGSSPKGIAITPDGARAYVTNAGATTVSVIDIATNTISATITVGHLPFGIAITPDGSKAYVTNQSGLSNSVSVIDVSTNTISTTIAVGLAPCGVSITPDGSTAYVANFGGKSVSVIDTSTETISATISLPTGSSPTAFGQFIQPQGIPMTSIYAPPQGRLTLTSNTPVMTADVTAATSVYYTPYQGNIVPIYDGANMQSYAFGQLTMALNTTNHLSGHVYDLFIFLNSSVVTIGAGPAWSSTTTRGSGAGTTQLQQTDGLWVNANTITLTNGSTSYSSIPVGEATYVGSVYMTANGQTQFNIRPAGASGGTNNFVGIFNGYNRVHMGSVVRDSAIGYTYASNTWRSMDNSNSNRVTYLDGLQQVSPAATVQISAAVSVAGDQAAVGVNLDSNSAQPRVIAFSTAPTGTLADNVQTIFARDSFAPQVGVHYIQAMESSISNVSATYNENGATAQLTVDLEY